MFPRLRNNRFSVNSSLGRLLVIFLVFGAGTIISVISWKSSETHAHTESVAKYQQELNQSKSVITESLAQYSYLLNDGASLLAVEGNNISQSQWLTFFQTYNLANNYPGVDAVSFSRYVQASQLANYLSNLSNLGQPNFTITPAGARAVYTPVTYIGYVSPVSLQALGYDQLTNPTRSAAITQALNTGKDAMSGEVKLVAVHKEQSAFIIYKPIYNGPSETLAERQASIFGFVFIAVNSNDFFNALLGSYIGPGLAVKVYDGNKLNDNALLYQTPNYSARVRAITSPVVSLLPIAFGGRTWTARVVISKGLIQASANQSSSEYLFFGIAISAAIAGVVWYFTDYRERKIHWQKQVELQAAKDELIAMASHQLRTPATIVKQYLGILVQNYAGSLSIDQRKLIKTAYDSNERQLEIANQFLDAARLGSGRIELSKETIIVNEILDQIVKEQRQIARGRHQKIIYKKPKRQYKIKGDGKYLPMVFENLINNAIKYSKRGSITTVSLHKSKQTVYVKITDSGIGIAADELPVIFEKFSRASAELNLPGTGTGIGLYLAKQILSLHGADISVESVLGKGSTFIVILPAANN